jgi:hypothetical protein
VYNLAVFISSFPYPSVEVGAVVMGIVVEGIIACGGKDGRLSGKVSWCISKAIIAVLSGVNWGIRFCKVLYFKPCINILVSILDLKMPLDYSL